MLKPLSTPSCYYTIARKTPLNATTPLRPSSPRHHLLPQRLHLWQQPYLLRFHLWQPTLHFWQERRLFRHLSGLFALRQGPNRTDPGLLCAPPRHCRHLPMFSTRYLAFTDAVRISRFMYAHDYALCCACLLGRRSEKTCGWMDACMHACMDEYTDG